MKEQRDIGKTALYPDIFWGVNLKCEKTSDSGLFCVAVNNGQHFGLSMAKSRTFFERG